MFDASIWILPGNGERTKFWTACWLNSASLTELAPDLFQAVASQTRHNRTLHQAMQNNQWIRDITGPITVLVLVQYLRIWELLQEIELQQDREDIIRWRWTSSGQYMAKSAYQMFFCGNTIFSGAKLIWKTWPPPKTKVFMYLAIHRCTWTLERRRRHGLQDTDECALCDQEPETVEHLLLHCPVAREIWWMALNFIQLPQRFHVDQLNICDTWE